MSYRHSFDSTGNMFFTKYSEPQSKFTNNEANPADRRRFRSTFQASKGGDQKKMDEIQAMFNNYTLFKYGQVATSTRKRNSTATLPIQDSQPRHKNMKERVKDNENLKFRLEGMRAERQSLFQKLSEITFKNARRN